MTIAAGVPAEVAQNSGDREGGQSWGSTRADSSGYGSGSNRPQVPKRLTGGKSGSSGSPSDGRAIPAPSNLLMLGLGLAGLIAGRMVALRRKKT